MEWNISLVNDKSQERALRIMKVKLNRHREMEKISKSLLDLCTDFSFVLFPKKKKKFRKPNKQTFSLFKCPFLVRLHANAVPVPK